MAPWALIAALAVLFCALAIAASSIGTLPGDQAVTTFVQRANGNVARLAWHIGNALGTTAWVSVLFVLVLVAVAALRWWRDAWFLLVVMLLRIIAMAFKGVVGSPRPTAAQANLHEIYHGTGFPSGHTLTSTVLLGGLAFVMVRHRRGRWVPVVACTIWIIGVLATGFARIWSGAHWASDVLGAAMLGVLFVLVAANVSAMLVPLTARPNTTTSDTHAKA
ncbi:MAG: phosphatase PAP2 family protein [Thermomicrobiales bacterium]